MRKLVVSLLAVVSVAAAVAQIWPQQDEWPMAGQNPRRTSSTRSNIAGSDHELWRRNLSVIRTEMITWTGAIAAHQRIYLHSKDTVAALDAANGKILWNKPVAAKELAATGDGIVVALTGSGLVGLDGATGDQKWETPLDGVKLIPKLIAGYDFVMLATDLLADPAEIDKTLLMFDCHTGQPITWNDGGHTRLVNQLSLFDTPSVLPASMDALVCVAPLGARVVPLPLQSTGDPTGAFACFGSRYIRGYIFKGETDIPTPAGYQTVSGRSDEQGNVTPAWGHSAEGPQVWGKATHLAIPTSAFAVGAFTAPGRLIGFNPTLGEARWNIAKGWPAADLAFAAQRIVGAFTKPGPDGTVIGTEIQAISPTDGKVGTRVWLKAVNVNTLIVAYHRLYVVGHYDPGIARAGAAHANIPVVICFGAK